MNAIVAADKNWAIGYKNKLLVSIPADMKFFRQMTGGKVVVMGRKTLESFPNGLPLKNRTNIVLTGNPNYHVKDAVIVHTTEELLEELKKFKEIKEVRGCGLMIGMEFDQPVKEIRSRLIHEQKVFTGASGTNVIRLLPPLCLSKEEADEFLARLRKVLG